MVENEGRDSNDSLAKAGLGGVALPSPEHLRLFDITRAVSTYPDFDAHQRVIYVESDDGLLRAVVGVHNDVLGVACGGSRFAVYDTLADGVTDVLRLSRGMTYKAALARIESGGGKAVLFADANGRHLDPANRRKTFEHYGRALSMVEAFVTAEDVGTFVSDIDQLAALSKRSVLGGSKTGGDPSPSTALGLVAAWEAALSDGQSPSSGAELFAGRTIAVQGVGKVGLAALEIAAKRGARFLVADTSEKNLSKARELGATVVELDAIHRQQADIFAPCALGAVLNERTIPQLGSKRVIGGANNQLARADDGQRLHDAGVLYGPDYVVNAGGIMHIVLLAAGLTREALEQRILETIPRNLREIFSRSKRENCPTSEIADTWARELVSAAERARN